MLAKINSFKHWQAGLIIAILGFAAYFDGLKNSFLGDDTSQIVTNIPVHSITHIRILFESSTFYNGQGLAPLIGAYYRPLMTTVFSVIYTLFGAHPFYFHLLQLLLCIGSSIILYLFFRYSFKPALALTLSLVFLLHPIDSQVVFAIASMEDALFFFFGILALYLLVRCTSKWSLCFVALALLMALLAKESGVLFVIMALVYLFWWNRPRFYPFLAIMAVPLAAYLTLKTRAIGLAAINPGISPIDRLGLSQRLMNTPSIIQFYFSRLVWPVHVAHAYYWVYPNFSVRHVLLPLLIDVAIFALLINGGLLVKRKASKELYATYLFFGFWAAIGLGISSQIIPLDMTACETWFYFSMVGILGMLGIAWRTFSPAIHFDRQILLVGVAILVALLGARTAVRGTNWSSQLTLAYHDVKVSKQDFDSDNNIASSLFYEKNLQQSEVYAKRSIAIYPYSPNYNTLGLIYFEQQKYQAAKQAFTDGIQIGPPVHQIYENQGALTVWYGSPTTNSQYLLSALHLFPTDGRLWLDLAILYYKDHDNAEAKICIDNATAYGEPNQFFYDHITDNQYVPFSLPSPNLD